MSYKLITGEFHIFYPDIPRQGPEPDGDTLKFKPDDRTLVEDLAKDGSVTPRFNGRGMVNLRFEGIDALETHFDGMHQNMIWGEAARNDMLRRAGFRQVRFWPDLPYKIQSVQNNPSRGFILVKAGGVDVYGRVISFVYPNDVNRPRKDDVHLQAPLLNQSLNAKLILAGLVYPAFYTSLPLDLQGRLAQLTIQAWNAWRGIWPEDTANTLYWQSIRNLNELQTLVIWPKLFRRLARYFAAGHTGLSGFDTWLRADPRDRDDRVLLPDGEVGNMHDLIEIDGNWIHMLYWPEEIVILPDNA